ncbi:MAG: RNA polymerase sigma factor [Planctomycetales bacterium]|nr:RNA polymerase sigma factor [Planctomycetales bacterium]
MVQELIEQHLTDVYRFAVYLVRDVHAAQDIAQETMLRAWRHRRQLRQAKSGKAWLLRITANLCRDYVRRSRHPVGQASSWHDAPDPRDAEPWQRLATTEAWEQLAQLVRSLPERERTVLYLSAFEELTHNEIAEVTETSTGAVKVALSRARQTVRAQLQKQQQDAP